MNELEEKIALLEMQIVAMSREIRNLRSRLEDTAKIKAMEQHGISFFTALKADDDFDQDANDEYTATTRQ